MNPARSLAYTALAGALALSAAACGSLEDGNTTREASDVPELVWEAPEDLSGTLTLYSANPQGLTDDLIREFTEATGVDVEVFGGETGNITARLDAEWSNPQADVVYVASWAPAARYADQGYTAQYQPFGYDSITEDWIGPDDAFIGRDGSALTLVVNTSVVDDVPADWSDLTDPAYEDQVIMPDPRESGTARDLITAMVADWGEDATWELFDDLFANGMVVRGANGPALDEVTAGSYGVVLGGVDYSAYAAIDRGEPLEVVLPASGTTVTPRPVFILEESPNREAAEAFVDFLFSQQGQDLSATHYMIPAQPQIPVADGAQDYEDIDTLDFVWSEIAENGADVLDEFTRRYLS